MKKSSKGSPTLAFIIMAIANFMAMVVFSVLYFLYTNADGERYTLMIIAAGISLVAGILMLFAYAYFHKKLHGD